MHVQARAKTWHCSFASEATRAAGAELALLPKKGTYELYYNRDAGVLSCDDQEIDASLLRLATTKLRVRAVKMLTPGRSTTASGMAVTPPLDSTATGGETLHYTLKVERVR